MNPCKKCIVRACCSEDCEVLDSFLNKAASIITFVSVLLACLILMYIMYCLNLFSVQPTIREKGIFTFIWGVSSVITIVINWRHEKFSEIVIVILGPFVLLTIVQVYLYSFLLIRNIRKRT